MWSSEPQIVLLAETISTTSYFKLPKKLFILRYVYYLISLFFDRILIEQYLFSFDTLS